MTGADGKTAKIGVERYRAWRSDVLGRVTEAIEHRLLLALLGNVAGRSVLDAGCGDGTLALELARRGAVVVGVDVDGDMIAHAQARTGRLSARFEVGRIEALPFVDASFDVVVAVTVLCLVADPARAVAEIARVLRPGGVLVVGELGRFSVWAAWRRLRGLLGAETWRRSRFFTSGELRALAAGVGLRVETVAGAVYYPPLDWAARLLGPMDGAFARLGPFGAAFLAMKAVKEKKP